MLPPWPVVRALGTPAEEAKRGRIAENLYEAVYPYLRDFETPHLMLTTTGSMFNKDLIGWLALSRHGITITGGVGQFFGDAGHQVPEMQRSDIVIASDSGTGEAYWAYDSTKKQDATLALARSQPHLVEVAQVEAHGGNHYIVFVRGRQMRGFGG